MSRAGTESRLSFLTVTKCGSPLDFIFYKGKGLQIWKRDYVEHKVKFYDLDLVLVFPK